MSTAMANTINNLKTIFLSPKLNSMKIQDAIFQTLVTFGLAYLITFFSAIISFFLSVFATENFTGKVVSTIVQTFIAVIRSVPTVLWVLMFAITIGLGSEAAVVGCMLHAIAYLTKMYSESLEEMDYGPIEALRASGASFWQIVFQGIAPTVLPSFTSWTFMRFEINYTVVLAMGATAGAGGLGFGLFMAGSFYYDMHEIGAITYIILITCFALEILSRIINARMLKEKTN